MPSRVMWYSAMPSLRPARPSAISADIAGSCSSKSSTIPGGAISRAAARRSSFVSPGS